MNIAANAVHSNILTVPAEAQRPGGDGFAFVRVVAQTSPGLYKISLGGRLMEARSNLSLEPGAFLRVQVRVVTGENAPKSQLQLVPEFTKPSALQQVLRFTEDSFQSGDIPQRLAQNLAALGLPVDGISGRLFSMGQQLGLRFDGRRMQRAYRIASNFPGRESQAAEVALMLLEKGMEADSAMVARVLSMMLGDREFFQDERGHESASSVPAADFTCDGFGSLGRLVEELYGCSMEALGGTSGLLTMLNHMATSSLHWLVVPFSLPLGVAADGSGLLGHIRVLFDLDSKKLLKIGVVAQSPSSHYSFMVYYGKDSMETVEYAPGGAGWQQALKALFPGVTVACRPMEALGLFCDPSQELASCSLEV